MVFGGLGFQLHSRAQMGQSHHVRGSPAAAIEMEALLSLARVRGGAYPTTALRPRESDPGATFGEAPVFTSLSFGERGFAAGLIQNHARTDALPCMRSESPFLSPDQSDLLNCVRSGMSCYVWW